MRDLIANDSRSIMSAGDGVKTTQGAFCALFALLIFLTFGSQLHGRTLRVGLTQNPPKTYWDEHGEAAGIFVDILNHIATAEGWEIEYHKDNWDNNLRLLQIGELDLVPDVAYSSERAKLLDFHQSPVLFSWTQLYARKGNAIKSFEDLDGLRLAVLHNSIQANVLSDMITGFGMNSSLVTADTFEDVLALVQDHKADVAATNNYFGRMNALRYNLEETGILFEPASLFFAAPKGRNAEILDTIDQHIIQLKRRPDTVYYKILRKHSSEAQEYRIPLWIIWGGSILLVTLVLSMVGAVLFKHQVRKRTAELMQANLEMEQRIEERTEELALAMHKAQVADMLKSAFLATMSHELRTPLNSVIGFTGILLKEMPGALNPEQLKMLKIVQTSGRHLLSLINDVLDISKIEAGELELHYTELELAPLLEKVISTMGAQAQEKGIELILKAGESPRTIHTDGRRLDQVLFNLLGNAVKFTLTGHVCLSSFEHEGLLHLSIEDTGIGIPADMLDKLFQPFMQVEMGMDRKYEGSGLGLFISQKIIGKMGGEISVTSEVGIGSNFTIILPLRGEELSCKKPSSS
jgi:signal transduction histidine kinase